MEITEQALERLMLCPMIDPAPSKMEGYINAITQWALRRSFENKLGNDPHKALADIRGKMIAFWKEFQMPGDPGSVSRTAGFRLFNLVLDYEVIHPEHPYNLILAGYTIKGKYSLLRKRKGEQLYYVLVLHDSVPSLKKEITLPPDIKSMVRFLHCRIQDGYTGVQVLHYPVIAGRWWMNKTINPALAQGYLQDMLKVVMLQPRFPIAGDHCKMCATKPCLEVFRNGQDDDSRK